MVLFKLEGVYPNRGLLGFDLIIIIVPRNVNVTE